MPHIHHMRHWLYVLVAYSNTCACCLSGRHLVRINLSEQTDMMDLLGADLPAGGGQAGQFAWCDGPLLAALTAGHWVLLDELNLAGARPCILARNGCMSMGLLQL